MWPLLIAYVGRGSWSKGWFNENVLFNPWRWFYFNKKTCCDPEKLRPRCFALYQYWKGGITLPETSSASVSYYLTYCGTYGGVSPKPTPLSAS